MFNAMASSSVIGFQYAKNSQPCNCHPLLGSYPVIRSFMPYFCPTHRPLKPNTA